MSAITAKASRKMKKYAVLTREPRCFLGSFDFSWEQRKVQDVADRFDNLRIPVAANLRVHGTTPYYGANGIQDYVDGFTHDGEFVLVAEDGANDLKNYPVKCVNGRIWVNNHAHVLQGKARIADNSFLAFAISQSDIESLLVGGGRAKLNAETLMSIEFRLPCLQEQYRIGEYLSQLDDLITLHQRKCALLFSSFQALISMMFTTSTFSWEQRKLGELALFNPKDELPQTFEYVDLESVVGTEMLSHRTEVKSSAPSRAQRLAHTGDLFYQTVRPYQKNNYLYEKPDNNYVFSTGYAQMRPYVDGYFLLSLVQSERFVKVVLDNCTGTSYPAINANDLAEIEVAAPSDESEAQKIGTIFRSIDNLITLHQRKCISFTGRAGRLISTVNKKRITSSWEQRKFSDVVATRRGLTYKPSDIRKNGVRVLRSSNIAEDSFALSDEDVFVVREAVNIDCARANDILITAANGSSRLVGKHTIISGIPEESAVHGGFMLLGTTKEPHFVNASMGSSWYRRFIELFVAGGNGAIGNLNKNDLDNQEIAIPSEDEQKKIGAFFQHLDNLITLHQRKPFLMKWRTSDANRNQTNRLVL